MSSTPLVPKPDDAIINICTYQQPYKERLVAINRLLAITTTESFQALIIARFLVRPEAQPVSFPITRKVLDATFSHPESDVVAFLSEDQSITVWKVGEKPQVCSHIENAKLGRIRWNPYNSAEIFCFSPTHVFILKMSKPNFEILLPVTGAETIEDIFFIAKSQEYFLILTSKNTTALTKENSKIMLAQYDIELKRLVLSETGINVGRPLFTFSESDKSKGVIFVDPKEFKDVNFKITNGEITKAIAPLSMVNVIPPDADSFIAYYNMKDAHLYLVFPKTSSYVILRHKKKKLANFISGTFSHPLPEIQGIVGVSQADAEEKIYFYNKYGIYVLMAKKNVPNVSQIYLPVSQVHQDHPRQPVNLLPNVQVEVKKEQKKSKGEQHHSFERVEDVPARDETTISLRALIKKEIDEGIKTLVLPIVDSHMKRFEEQFKELVGIEVSSLKAILQSETIRMQNTGKVFESFMERMMEVSRRFTGSLEQQMKGIEIAMNQRTTPIQPSIPDASPFLIPSQSHSYSQAPPMEYQRSSAEYGRTMQEYPSGEYGGSSNYKYLPPGAGFMLGNVPRAPGL